MDNNISFSKIVATPTLNSWSQAYNAGKLFAVLSLEKTKDPSEIESLNMLGKDLLERLEQEFFVIEDKNLESIKKAVATVFENTAEGVTISFAAGTFVNNILYLFGLGNSKVFIKRGRSLGLALVSENASSKNLASSSGFIKENDLIVLTTDAFSQVVTEEELNASLNDIEPSEITESLAPKIHKAENGKISAIVIKYQNPAAAPMDAPDDLDEGLQEKEVVIEETIIDNRETPVSVSPVTKYLDLFKSKLKISSLKIQPIKKLFLIAAVGIAVILIASVFLGIQEQNKAKSRALFAQIYPQAQKKYDEGQGLVELNKTYARDSFLAAQKILQDNKDKFPTKSKESLQTQDLLKKIKDGLSLVSPIDKSGLDRSKLSITVLNGSGVEGTAGKAANILKDFGYNVASTGNADNYNYTGVTIKVKPDQSNFLNLLKQDLAKEYTIKSTSSDLSPDSSTDALIIIGK
ncbi:MAG: Cell envelope-related transcriptional attenuator [Candidatus Levybacteria bacterium GW2011_GWA2_37_36]|nr:MAG: Cell envelope-related transcriptional attenuator [Candidatus Levybacteria bacterium GW2011_GWA1_37_16]KKQ32443.1 MAG: Cell envelope-related transcriptional attenuator [Candidatus Levybacteria bacterium GW2011_GWA2_37_36]KKQ38684.1 MAG: Cell envelope-related transcriptional attenuator [Candidatus Levybacteria bacterium GW2011_GWC2_37_7]KKQ41980.1 MAG: Cell envelope-related transcriptional attenuator [Candidatus Levybacteria bacterium GW2011_GWB1_37_8]OGH50108.1 MAG: hypothetical protein 